MLLKATHRFFREGSLVKEACSFLRPGKLQGCEVGKKQLNKIQTFNPML